MIALAKIYTMRYFCLTSNRPPNYTRKTFLSEASTFNRGFCIWDTVNINKHFIFCIKYFTTFFCNLHEYAAVVVGRVWLVQTVAKAMSFKGRWVTRSGNLAPASVRYLQLTDCRWSSLHLDNGRGSAHPRWRPTFTIMRLLVTRYRLGRSVGVDRG